MVLAPQWSASGVDINNPSCCCSLLLNAQRLDTSLTPRFLWNQRKNLMMSSWFLVKIGSLGLQKWSDVWHQWSSKTVSQICLATSFRSHIGWLIVGGNFQNSHGFPKISMVDSWLYFKHIVWKAMVFVPHWNTCCESSHRCRNRSPLRQSLVWWAGLISWKGILPASSIASWHRRMHILCMYIYNIYMYIHTHASLSLSLYMDLFVYLFIYLWNDPPFLSMCHIPRFPASCAVPKWRFPSLWCTCLFAKSDPRTRSAPVGLWVGTLGLSKYCSCRFFFWVGQWKIPQF